EIGGPMRRDCLAAVLGSLGAMALASTVALAAGATTAALAAVATTGAHAAGGFPTRPLPPVGGVFPRGLTGIAGRGAAHYLTAHPGQPVVVENRTVAGGTIGLEAVVRSAPDGHVLGVAATSQIAISPFTSRLGFDPLTELMPVAPIAEAPQFLVVNAKVPARTLQDFIAYARERPGKLNYVSLGPGSTVSLAGDRFVRLARVDMVPVQYRGTTPGIADLLADQVQMISIGIAPVLGFVQAGTLRALAAGAPKRLPYLPDVPTAAE